MKKNILFLFWILSLSSASAGHRICGTVVDSLGNGLAYVNAGIAGTGVGTVSSPDGAFSIVFDEEEVSADDSLRFSMIGYRPLTMPVATFLNQDSVSIRVVLQRESLELHEVTVMANELVRKKQGNTNTTTTMSNNMAISGLPGQNLGAEVGRKFALKGKPHRIDKLNFFIKYCNFDTVVLRVNVYDIEGGKPGKKLVKENMIFTLVKHRKGWVTFDLSPWNIVVDENIIVSVEWIGQSAKGSLFGFPITVPAPGAVHYYKFGSQAEWKRYLSMSTAMNLEVLSEK